MIEKIKIIIKYFLGSVRARKNGIVLEGKVYIGKQCNIKGRKNIILGKNVAIRSNVDMWCMGKMMIGEETEIGQRVRISIANECLIGNHVLFSPNVYVTDCDHKYTDINVPVINQGIMQGGQKVHIGDGCYIGINSVIVGNVTIGKGTIVGANSVITHSLPDYCVAVGAPAKVIKKYNFNTQSWENTKPVYSGGIK